MHCNAKYLWIIYVFKNAFFLVTLSPAHDSNLIQFYFQLIQNRLEKGTQPLAISGVNVSSKVMQTCTIIMLKLWEFNCNNFTNYQFTSRQDTKVKIQLFFLMTYFSTVQGYPPLTCQTELLNTGAWQPIPFSKDFLNQWPFKTLTNLNLLYCCEEAANLG